MAQRKQVVGDRSTGAVPSCPHFLPGAMAGLLLLQGVCVQERHVNQVINIDGL
jgi:hypothetical protein